jgi:hypothetical protein
MVTFAVGWDSSTKVYVSEVGPVSLTAVLPPDSVSRIPAASLSATSTVTPATPSPL